MRECSVDGCDRGAIARGLCRSHYERLRSNGKAMPPATRTGWVKQPPTCSVADCGKTAKSRGLCAMHARRLRVHGDLNKTNRHPKPPCSVPGCQEPARSKGMCQPHYHEQKYAGRGGGRICSVEGCGRGTERKCGLCAAHRSRLRRKGTELSDTPIGKISRRRSGSVTGQGYRVFGSRTGNVLEHREVMERLLGRKLLKQESVHHINGDRLDNRIENLELWSKSHPSGQRVEDKVAWAIELLRLYRPEALSDGASDERAA